MITCSRCGKENQDHYKFCLGCGAKLEAAAAPAPAPSPAPSPGLTPAPAAVKPAEKASVPLGMAKTAVPPAGSVLTWITTHFRRWESSWKNTIVTQTGKPGFPWTGTCAIAIATCRALRWAFAGA